MESMPKEAGVMTVSAPRSRTLSADSTLELFDPLSEAVESRKPLDSKTIVRIIEARIRQAALRAAAAEALRNSASGSLCSEDDKPESDKASGGSLVAVLRANFMDEKSAKAKTEKSPITSLNAEHASITRTLVPQRRMPFEKKLTRAESMSVLPLNSVGGHSKATKTTKSCTGVQTPRQSATSNMTSTTAKQPTPTAEIGKAPRRATISMSWMSTPSPVVDKKSSQDIDYILSQSVSDLKSRFLGSNPEASKPDPVGVKIDPKYPKYEFDWGSSVSELRIQFDPNTAHGDKDVEFESPVRAMDFPAPNGPYSPVDNDGTTGSLGSFSKLGQGPDTCPNSKCSRAPAEKSLERFNRDSQKTDPKRLGTDEKHGKTSSDTKGKLIKEQRQSRPGILMQEQSAAISLSRDLSSAKNQQPGNDRVGTEMGEERKTDRDQGDQNQAVIVTPRLVAPGSKPHDRNTKKGKASSSSREKRIKEEKRRLAKLLWQEKGDKIISCGDLKSPVEDTQEHLDEHFETQGVVEQQDDMNRKCQAEPDDKVNNDDVSLNDDDDDDFLNASAGSLGSFAKLGPEPDSYHNPDGNPNKDEKVGEKSSLSTQEKRIKEEKRRLAKLLWLEKGDKILSCRDLKLLVKEMQEHPQKQFETQGIDEPQDGMYQKCEAIYENKDIERKEVESLDDDDADLLNASSRSLGSFAKLGSQPDNYHNYDGNSNHIESNDMVQKACSTDGDETSRANLSISSAYHDKNEKAGEVVSSSSREKRIKEEKRRLAKLLWQEQSARLLSCRDMNSFQSSMVNISTKNQNQHQFQKNIEKERSNSHEQDHCEEAKQPQYDEERHQQDEKPSDDKPDEDYDGGKCAKESAKQSKPSKKSKKRKEHQRKKSRRHLMSEKDTPVPTMISSCRDLGSLDSEMMDHGADMGNQAEEVAQQQIQPDNANEPMTAQQRKEERRRLAKNLWQKAKGAVIASSCRDLSSSHTSFPMMDGEGKTDRVVASEKHIKEERRRRAKLLWQNSEGKISFENSFSKNLEEPE